MFGLGRKSFHRSAGSGVSGRRKHSVRDEIAEFLERAGSPDLPPSRHHHHRCEQHLDGDDDHYHHSTRDRITVQPTATAAAPCQLDIPPRSRRPGNTEHRPVARHHQHHHNDKNADGEPRRPEKIRRQLSQDHLEDTYDHHAHTRPSTRASGHSSTSRRESPSSSSKSPHKSEIKHPKKPKPPEGPSPLISLANLIGMVPRDVQEKMSRKEAAKWDEYHHEKRLYKKVARKARREHTRDQHDGIHGSENAHALFRTRSERHHHHRHRDQADGEHRPRSEQRHRRGSEPGVLPPQYRASQAWQPRIMAGSEARFGHDRRPPSVASLRDYEDDLADLRSVAMGSSITTHDER